MIRYSHLEGIEFQHGIADCFTTLQRFFADNFDIKIRNYARPDDWWEKGMNLYMDNFRREGFTLIDPTPQQLRIADCFLMAIYRDGSHTPKEDRVANHIGIYVGGGRILHHLYGQRSCTSPYRGFLRNGEMAVIRHKDVKLEDVVETFDVMEMVPAHKRRQLEQAIRDHQAD